MTNPQSESQPTRRASRRDVITAVNGDAVKNPRELARKIGNFSPEEKGDSQPVAQRQVRGRQ
ncbi:MAG: hypothetical protein R3D29_00400 [Nitratireductor sp.]